MELKGKYVVRNNVDAKYVNGVFGGSGISDEIIIHFYYESFTLPEEFIINIKNDEVDDTNVPNDIKLVRDVNSSVMMSLKTAKELYEWLGNRIKQFESEDDSDEL